MPSTNKTRVLNLNQWIASDSPKMSDFNKDNEILENSISQVYKNIVYSNGQFELTKVDDSFSNIDIRDIIKQITSDKLTEVGIATNTINSANLNNYLKNGLYVNNKDSSRIRNITTAVINFQYETNWGVQLAMTEEDDPKLYIRAKRNNRWTDYKEMVYKTDVATDTKQGIISKNEIKNIFNVYTVESFIESFKGE